MANAQFQTAQRGLDPVALGLAIRDRRKGAKMTQEVTAALCGISKKTLIKIEKGGDVYFSTLLQVMNALGMHLQLVPEIWVTSSATSTVEPDPSTDKPTGGDDEWF